jgi:excinuclease UvrABC nuclease subunit
VFEQAVLELFQIRRCTEDLEPSAEHPGCIYGEMNLCLRPCQLAVSAEEYRSEAMRVAAFFESGGRSLMEPLQSARNRFSDQMDF